MPYSVCSFRAFYLDKSNLPPNSTSKAAYIDKVNKNVKCLIKLCMLHTVIVILFWGFLNSIEKLNYLKLGMGGRQGKEELSFSILSHLCFRGMRCHVVLYQKMAGGLQLEKGNHNFPFSLCFQSNAIAPGPCGGWKDRVGGEQVQAEICCCENWKRCSKLNAPSASCSEGFLQMPSFVFKPLWLRDPRVYENSFSALSCYWRVNDHIAAW